MKPASGSDQRRKDAMDPELPLDEDELDELDDFLRSEAVGEDAMDVSMLDGFLTALAVGPTNLPPALWLPMIWGKGATGRRENRRAHAHAGAAPRQWHPAAAARGTR
jgi:uncharacterized protein YecA (UPF0149 family)